MAEIIRLYGPRQTGGSVVGERPEQEQRIALRANVATNVSTFVSSQSPLTPEELYHGLDESRSSLRPALLLLHEAERHLADGEAAAKDNDMVAADDAMQRVQALLPELFCCRALGDSFATVINAFFHGLKNRAGAPIELRQLAAAHAAIKHLRREPFLPYSMALSIVASLEASWLTVEPAGLSIIAEALLG